MKIFRDKAWLRSLAGLSINISAAFFVAPFVGANFLFPTTLKDILFLSGNIIFGIVFLRLSVSLERRLKR